MFVYKQLHPAAAIICAVATLTIAPAPASIPIPSPMTPTKIAPDGNMPESAVISPEPTVKLGSWHEIVIVKPAIMTASPAITISHPAIRINTISTHAAKLWIFCCMGGDGDEGNGCGTANGLCISFVLTNSGYLYNIVA